MFDRDVILFKKKPMKNYSKINTTIAFPAFHVAVLKKRIKFFFKRNKSLFTNTSLKSSLISDDPVTHWEVILMVY